MNLQNYYWYFTGALSHKFCNEVIEFGKMQQEQTAKTGNLSDDTKLSKEEIKKIKKKRNSNIVWMKDNWIYKEIMPYVELANKSAGWNFDFNYSESCQFTKYAPNQYYGWHCDSWEVPYNQPDDLNYNGKIRKLSVTCSLSDSSEYSGGELEFNFNHPEKKTKDNIRKCNEILPKGSIVVFPSFVWHRVCPVNQGTRYSLVIWNLGYPFK
jgi:PKHD-type hydroxylase